MSKIFDVEKMYGQDFSIVTTNAPSNVIKNSEMDLLPSIMLISSPEDEINTNNDNNYPALFVTDYNSNPLQLTYPLYMKNGLSLSDKYGYAYINIDQKTISTTNEDGTGSLYVNTNNLTKASIENFGVVKVAEEMGIERDYKIGNIQIPNDTFINVNEDGIIYLSNNFFDWVGDIITKQVKEKVDNIKLILNNNLRIWLEITDTNISEIGSIYNLNTANSSIDISSDSITSITFNLKYLSFYNDSEYIRFSDISEHNIFKIEYNGSNITNQNILTIVEEYNDDLFLHSIDNISLTFLPNYYIDDYNLNNNEEYNLSIEFTNNSSHPTEKITFKQPQLFDTSNTTKFNISLSQDHLAIQNIINTANSNNIYEQISNNVFNNIIDNGIDIVKYYIYTYVNYNDIKWPLIDKQEYELNNGNIIIDNNIIKDLVTNVIMLYLQTSETSDRYEVIQNQSFIDTVNNTIDIICEFIININNKEYIYKHIHPMQLLLLKYIEYGLFFADNTLTLSSQNLNGNKINQYFLQLSNKELIDMSKLNGGFNKENIQNNIDTIDLTNIVGIITEDLNINNNNIFYYLNYKYLYTYTLVEDHYELNEYDNEFGLKDYIDTNTITIVPQDIDGNKYITLNIENNELNVISSLMYIDETTGLSGLSFDTQYGTNESSIINNKIHLYIDILDIILNNIEVITTTNTYNLKGQYNFEDKNKYNMHFNNYTFNSSNINPQFFKQFKITIPEYIKYLLNYNITNNNGTDENRFGIKFRYPSNREYKDYQIEVIPLGSNRYNIQTIFDNSNGDPFNVTYEQENNNLIITISGIIEENSQEEVFYSIQDFIFTLRNIDTSIKDDNGVFHDNDIFFTKSIKFTTLNDDISWDGFKSENIINNSNDNP